jgi:sugar-specific transcriptional regulator TrmB/DNA-binding CsgD family transcriptional regulator
MPLRDLGITEPQEAAYRALLADCSRDVPEIAVLLRADERAIRASLAGLADLGVLRRCPDAPAGFRPRDPSAAIGELIERMEDETLRRHRAIAGVRAELAGLTRPQLERQADQAIGLEALAEPGDVRERLAELSFFTRNSVWAIQPAGLHSRASRTAATHLDQRSLRRGVDMRIIYDAAVLNSAHSRAMLRQRIAEGARVRVRPGPLQRLIIMDERVAVTQADPADSQRGAMIVRQRGLLNGFLELFRLSWDNAQDVQFDDAPDDESLTNDDRVVLDLLASGTTDELAARGIGISVRHFRRRVARLMGELQAGSRFQAGALAARRGWI